MSEVKKKKIQLVNGHFTPSEASDMVSALIDEEVNFHKIRRWSQSIHDETADASNLSGKIAMLQQQKQTAKELIASARARGYNVRINGTLEITIEE